MSERRARVQSDRWTRTKVELREGTVAWSEHEEAWQAYAKQWGTDQSAATIERRHGFGYTEMTNLLGHEPTTWEPTS